MKWHPRSSAGIKTTCQCPDFLAFYWEFHWEIEFYEVGTGPSVDDHKARVFSDWAVFVDVSSSSKPPTGYDQFLDVVAADRSSEPTRVRTEFPPLRDIPDTGPTRHKGAEVDRDRYRLVERHPRPDVFDVDL